jgi:hypothetical protein
MFAGHFVAARRAAQRGFLPDIPGAGRDWPCKGLKARRVEVSPSGPQVPF